MKACRWVFISKHRNTFGVQRLCQVLCVHRSANYKWLAGTAPEPARRQTTPGSSPSSGSSTASAGTYSVPRIPAELRGQAGGSTANGSPG